MDPTLLILAAGLGRRYGGLKQMDPVGDCGETIIDYTAFDALRAGFGQLVFVIRREMEADFRQTIGARLEKRFPVRYAFQELGDLPPGVSMPAGREKPWGTGHAVLAAADLISGPFGVVNADDFYGMNSLAVLAGHLGSGGRDYAMVGFKLRDTLSSFSAVARGLCRVSGKGYLQAVTEITGIERDGDGARYTDQQGRPRRLDGGATVSMNLWGFHPTLFDHLRRQFSIFLRTRGQEPGAEFYMPSVVNTLVQAGQERCRVLPTSDAWCGVTCREDRPRVMEAIRSCIARGTYPHDLWRRP
jgi:MobA-like NTP transferase domain